MAKMYRLLLQETEHIEVASQRGIEINGRHYEASEEDSTLSVSPITRRKCFSALIATIKREHANRGELTITTK